MKLLINTILTFVLLLFVAQLNAQMTNTGQMYIKQDTDVSVLQNFINKDTASVVNNGVLYLSKNFNNDGIVSFTNERSAKTIFKGLEIQQIEGEGITELYNFEVYNSSIETSIKLNKQIDIFGQVDLFDGIVEELENGMAVFHFGASHNNLNDNSYLDNKVYKQGNEAFIFPIGHNNLGSFTCRYTAISAPNKSTDIFSAEYIWKNSNSQFNHQEKEADITNINTEEYWVIKPENGNSIVDITLSWSEITTSSSLLFNPESIVIVRWNGEKWVNEKGVINLEEKTVTTTPTGYGVFTLGNTNTNIITKIVYPNSFSPNGDGINDTFKIPGLANSYPNFIMKIYNRYGNIVYNYSNKGNKNPKWWNGKSQGRLNVGGNKAKVPAATYWYVLDYNDGSTKSIQKWLYLNK